LKFKKPFYLLEFEKLKNLKESLKKSLKKGYEGVILKNLNSPYLISKEAPMATHHWRKLKG
jgi:ATP-dependent DNA ligase